MGTEESERKSSARRPSTAENKRKKKKTDDKSHKFKNALPFSAPPSTAFHPSRLHARSVAPGALSSPFGELRLAWLAGWVMLPAAASLSRVAEAAAATSPSPHAPRSRDLHFDPFSASLASPRPRNDIPSPSRDVERVAFSTPASTGREERRCSSFARRWRKMGSREAFFASLLLFRPFSSSAQEALPKSNSRLRALLPSFRTSSAAPLPRTVV